ncbi:hypothetical protein NM897_16885 (plasmid) [Planococcus maritimus]|uniref:hypothetical protein n=1 Tax=Planococcus maritimus TaxID=192421 RepID=UPI0031391D36
MVIRTIANRVGTIEIDQNAFYFLQPLSAFKTEEMEQIERAYEKQMQQVTGDPTFLSAQEISFQSGQVRFEYDLKDLHSFNALKAMEFEDKLTYYLSLVQLARQSEINVLWQKENFVLNKEEVLLHVMVAENDVMPLSHEKDRLTAVKELIIISLTRLNQVYGRPRRTDFLEQSDEVIRFAETIYLRLQSLEEMESYISDVFNQVEEQKKAKQQELELAKQNQTKWSVKMASLRESLQRLPSFNEQPKENRTIPAVGGNKKLFVGVAAVLLAAFGLNVVLTQATENAQETELGEGTDDELNLTDVYRDGLLGDTVSVLESLESVDYSELHPADQNVLNRLYIEHGEYEKALHHQPELLGTIAEQLSRDGDAKGLENLQEMTDESSEVIEFELAAVEEEWTRIVELRNQVELTDWRVETVLAAFIAEKDFQGAKGFLEKQNLTDEKLMSSVLEAEKEAVHLEELQAEKQKLKETIEKENDKKVSKKTDGRLREINQEIEEITQQE